MVIIIGQDERGILFINGVAVRWLRPGRHFVWRPFSKVAVKRLSANTLVVPLRTEEAALAPAQELTLVQVGETQRAVVMNAGRPVKWLSQGDHYVLTLDAGVRVEELDVSAVAAPVLAPLVAALAPANEYVQTEVPHSCVALRYVDGSLDTVLPPGLHAAWNVVHRVKMAVVDLRERVLNISGQDVMTKDRVSVRINISAVFHVADVRVLAQVATSVDDALYLAIQLAARDAVSARSLDGLLSAREALAEELLAAVTARASALGVKLVSVGFKDIILPGDIRDLMNKVVAAQKAAEANVITRREETAATRSLAQTAQLMAEHPVLMRLKELEAYKELAEKVGTVHLVMGEGALPQLQLKAG